MFEDVEEAELLISVATSTGMGLTMETIPAILLWFLNIEGSSV